MASKAKTTTPKADPERVAAAALLSRRLRRVAQVLGYPGAPLGYRRMAPELHCSRERVAQLMTRRGHGLPSGPLARTIDLAEQKARKLATKHGLPWDALLGNE